MSADRRRSDRAAPPSIFLPDTNRPRDGEGRLGRSLRLVLLAASACVLLTGGRCTPQPPGPPVVPPWTGASPQPAQAAEPALESWQPLPAILPAVAERAVRSAVNISTTRTLRFDHHKLMPRGGGDSFFEEFFGRHFEWPPAKQKSLGSGVIVSASGLVLTNHHVIGDADSIEVTTVDGRTLSVSVVGSDERSDLAVMQIEDVPDDLEPLSLEDVAAPRLGEFVIAVGNPFGVGRTVTLGIVSATGRRGLGIADYEDFIQTDAAINPGNSGGALVDMRGRLVGINTAIFSRSGGTQGVGFAIPTALAREVLQELTEHGSVRRGWLGVIIQDLDAGLAEAFGVEDGVVVADVQPDSPAAKAGVKRGDVLLRFEGEEVTDTSQLRMAVAAADPGAPFTLELSRDGTARTLKGVLGTLEEPGEDEEVEVVSGAEHGLELGELDAEARRRLDVPESVKGVLVLTVEPGSAASRAGLQPGDVVVEADRSPLRSPQELRRSLTGDGSLLLLVWRGGATHFVVLKR